MTVNKTDLLAALACATVTAPVEGFGTVNIRQVSVAENDAIRARIKADADAPPSAFGLQLLAASVVNDDGTPVFTEADVAALRACAGRKVDKLVTAVLQANGYGEETPGNARASGPTQNDASASASPSPSA
jgi:hypothetical protein